MERLGVKNVFTKPRFFNNPLHNLLIYYIFPLQSTFKIRIVIGNVTGNLLNNKIGNGMGAEENYYDYKHQNDC